MTFSVVIPTHNRSAKLARALASVVEQGDAVRETVVVDDASRPDEARATAALVAATPRAVLVRLDGNVGAAAARNAGVARSSAPLLAFLDSDDWWRPGRLAAHARAFADDAVVLSYNPALVVRSADRPPRGTVGRDKPGAWRFEVALAAWNFVGGCSAVCVRRTAFDAAGGFDQALPSCQDWDLWLRLGRLGRAHFSPEPTTFFDIGPHARITSAGGAVARGHARFYEKVAGLGTSGAERRYLRAERLWTDAEIAVRFGQPAKAMVAAVRSLATRPSNRTLRRIPGVGLAVLRRLAGR